MPNWVLTCLECQQDFIHSKVETRKVNYGRPYAWIAGDFKPEFPDGGASVECPNCKTAALYQRHQLIYRAEH